MKLKNFSPVVRVILIIGLILGLIWGCLIVASAMKPQPANEQTAATIASDHGLLTFADGQQMTGENLTLSANLSAPAPMLLPLKTLADFPASPAATQAEITTNRGKLTLTLFPDEAPLTVANFVALAASNFYDGLKFHRLDPGFVLQIGDPASRQASSETDLQTLGTGYPGYRIADEFAPARSHDQAGMVSMANINLNGEYPNSGGSQFFFTLAGATYLDGRHAIFAQVTDGLPVLEQLGVGDEIIDIKTF